MQLFVRADKEQTLCPHAHAIEHTRADIDVETEKPQIVLVYNQARGVVDHLAQTCVWLTRYANIHSVGRCVTSKHVTKSNAIVL
jgi:hypothetical protein